ncbi:P-loop containing nucleoside triphosphate hydrolase protein [Clathrospora elynae]|uniref:P-loop containing nucleoside triphosphate hydrolase protein n=1 Tax=Clathrospora elynae TaxID=706981 RepID=A0A6A5SW58_9PLEO|nr:P-loop containing nucleoside triphosphate hydrolase protein [Clathrospora elynae]
MAGDKQDTTDQIFQWYSKLYSRRVDLVGDFAGSERFLVHGESLLLQCFSDPHIDFEPGYQLLHATYAVEKFLQGLVSRCCNFHIAFFDEHQDLCVPQNASPANSEKYLLARAAIIRHLKVNLPDVLPDIEINTFPSSSSDAFGEYLRTTDIYFVLCHDGASTSAQKDEDRSLQERHQQYKASFRTFIYSLMQRGYSAALVNGLEWRDTKVVTTVLEHARSMTLDVSTTEPHSNQKLTDIVDLSHMRGFLQTIRSSCDQLLTEREYLTVLVASKLTTSDASLSSVLLQQAALLSELPLLDRCVAHQEITEEINALILDFCHEARKFIGSPAWGEAFAGHPNCDLSDLIDGRLLAYCAQNPSEPSEHLKTLLKATAALNGRDIPGPSSTGLGASTGSAPSNGQDEEDFTYKVLPFTNSTFDDHLAPIHLDVSRSGGKADQTSAAIFREVTHWHNQRSINQKTRVVVEKDPKIAKKALRRNQFFMAEMTSYAASLTNAVGKVLDPETITLGDKSKAAPAKSTTPTQILDNRKPKQQQKQSTKNINASKQAMLADIAASSKRKDEENAKQLYQAWSVFCDGLEKQVDLASRYNRARQYLANLNSESKRQTLGPEVRIYMLNVLLEMWIRFCRDSAKEKGLYVAALLFDTARTLCNFPAVTKTIASCLTATVERLKLPALQVPQEQGDRKLPFKFVLDETLVSDLALTLSPEEFQLLHCGPYFDRTIDSAPDSRVAFEPDAWQRRVLDEIDARRSLLVIAPTSAGKTFISFYAMKQVLESNNDDVLVYVAPTKALVNQIAAEIQARFSKNYKYSQSVWGIHTRDYRINNPTGCQILVTVPHILQIMLLAPSNARSWSERVKWIIFDEVHCIGQAEDGLVWEQLLLMAPCPIIALSATIGNAEAFNDWLAASQKAAGHELVMVQHPHRYSDLRKFIYSPPAKRIPASYLPLPTHKSFAQLGLDEHADFAFLHPVASLINRTRGLPSDLSLEARDCLTLWQSISKHQTADYPVDKSLNPSAVLPTVIKKADIIKWQSALKKLLTEWMADEASPFEAVRRDLSKSFSDLALRDSDEDSHEDDAGNDGQVDELGMEISHDISSLLPLLADLQLQDALPGIIFNYDRAICEKMCQTLLKQLTDAEVNWKQSSPKWKDKLLQWEEWKKEVARREKQGLRGEASKGMTKQDQMREAANVEVSAFASFDPNKPLDGFHFADNKKLSQEEFAVHAKELRYRGVEEWLIDGLMRGIGVHHAGLNRKYRYCVEMLFRKGYLRVVIATGTLALGINMPCKTVVFSGDSVFLTALNFRQAAGRAGRRGFDMLGNVVFHGVSLSKIHKLISSRLPDLNGHFPITTTLVLRLFTLLNSSENSPFAVRCVNSLLSQPRLYLGGEDAKMTVLHHLRFSIEYLRRQHLLDAQGVPLNFAGAVSHLYFTENSSFAFHALLKDGYLHELCAKIDTNKEMVLRELMLTMSHLFGRQHCRQADVEYAQEVVKKSPSVVFLPPMPEQAANVLRRHNKATLDIFTAYVRTFVDQHIEEPDNTLPLTELTVGGDSPSKAQHREVKARSAFVALSGYDDKFESIHDLCSTTRSGVFLEEAVVPHVGLYPEDSDLPLNAYLYDFFMHGDVNALITANKIRRGDVWFVLNDLSMTLATITTSLTNFLGLGAESDLDFIDVRGGGDDEEENREDKMLPTDAATEASFATTAASNSKVPPKQELAFAPKKKAKKVVEESWEDEMGDSASESEVEESWDADDDDDKEKPTWEEGEGLLNVLKAFKALKEDFDTKFKAMWA